MIALRRPSWSNDRHAVQWHESLKLHAYPVIGGMAVDKITTADLLEVLEPIWLAKAETAARVKQRIGTILDYAVAKQWRDDNPTVSISSALPRRTRVKAHHPAIPYTDVPDAVKAIRESTARVATRLALEFMILTAARAGEVRGATWDEIDFDSATWTIPAHRMKARRGHRVPLANRALEILSEARELPGSTLVFSRSRKPLTNMAFSMLLRRLNLPCVPHGFRSSFRDWTIAETGTPWAIGEAALAHALGNSLESAYARTDLFERRRALMDEWANFAAGRGKAGEVSGLPTLVPAPIPFIPEPVTPSP